MAAVTSRMDELVKDYLLYRGFTGSLRTLENELKTDKERGLRVDKITDQIQSFVTSFDLGALREYWSFLNNKFFSRLEQKQMGSVRKLEVGLFKFYLVTASQNNRPDKIREFFEMLTPELQNQQEFKEWFTFPFIRSPEENNHFALYFTRQWQDTFFLSLYNFLSVMLQSMPAPVLLTFEHDQKKMRSLREENDSLKTQIRNHPDFQSKSRSQTVTNGVDLMDDFFSISEDTTAQENQSRARSEKKFFNFPSSPLIRRKPANVKTSSTTDGNLQGRNRRTECERDETTNNTFVKNTAKVRQIGHVQNPMQNIPQLSVSVPIGSSQGQITFPTTPDSRLRKPDDGEKWKREKKKEEYDRQRKELLGRAESERKQKMRNGDNSTVSTQLPKPEAPEPEPVVRVAPDTASDAPSVDSTAQLSSIDNSKAVWYDQKRADISTIECSSANSGLPLVTATECPFLLLSQEDYGEHHSAISSCCFSNTGQYIASSDVDGVVKVWTWSPQPVTKATIMSKSSFLSLSWTSKTDRLLLLGNKSGNIKLFDVKDIKTIYDVTADPTYPRLVSLCANPTGSQFVCSGSADKHRSSSGGERSSGRVGRLSVWELKTMKMTGTLPVGPGPVAVNCSCYNHNGQLLITGAADGVIRVFDMRQFSCISQWSAHDGEVVSIQLSSDETSCYSMGTDGKFMEWSINNRGRRVADLPIHPGAYPMLPLSTPTSGRELPRGKLFSFDAEGSYVLTCSRSGGIIYERTSQTPGLARTMELKGHRSGVTTVDWSPSVETRVCLTGAMDGKVKVSTLLSR